MPTIRVLPLDLKNKIAAGEVVERPASVVKELLENAIDAGANSVTVEIELAGRKLIRVIDDGAGMSEEDARLCIERHATSKLTGDEDLFCISTMGFRGEALPSIASISRMQLSTVLRGESSGITLHVRDGVIQSEEPAPGRGTSIEVRDLFYNTPARRKFLKRDSTELTHIIDTVSRLSLSHPRTGFTLLCDGKRTIEVSPAASLRERIAQMYGMEFMDGLVEAQRTELATSLYALVSRYDNLRDNRSHQLLFINRRPVRDPSLAHAVLSAYEGIAPRGLHPIFFLFIELDPATVDFNVHPAKREVRLQAKDFVYRFVRRAVMDAVRPQAHAEGAVSEFEDYDTPAAEQTTASDAAPSDVTHNEAIHNEARTLPRLSSRDSGSGGSDSSGAGSYRVASGNVAQWPPSVAHPSLAHSSGGTTSLPMDDMQMARIFIDLGETFAAYSDPRTGGLSIIDYHAAHERVLYEKLLRGLDIKSNMLLFPRQVQLSPKEFHVILDQRETLLAFGIEVDDFGTDTVIVRSLPEALDQADMRGILSDAAGAFLEGDRPGQSVREAVAARIACHGSVRGRRLMRSEELNALLTALFRAEDPWHCPHGRPTIITLSTDELKKRFKRT